MRNRLSDASARLVELQWLLVRSYQSVDEHVAAALHHEELELQQDRARASVKPLSSWPGLPPKVDKAFKQGPDLARLRRVLDLVRPGDRVLEIGTGQGYMTGVLLRDRQPAHYCGVDINPHLIEAVDKMAEANGIDLTGHHTQVCDLFDLTPEFVSEHDPDVVLLLEVVEHVQDPAAALRTVSSVLAEDTVLVFSVPLLGRIEGCWGHVSLFDDRRIRALCEQANLLVQNVEVVQNHWVLIVAALSELPPERRAGLAVPVEETTPGQPIDYDLRRVSLLPHSKELQAWRGSPAARSVEIEPAAVGVKVSVRGGQGGVALSTPSAGIVRIEIAFEDERDLTGLWVEQFDEAGASLARWHWAAKPRDLHERFLTYIFRSGVRARTFDPIGESRDGTVATTVISLQTKGDRRAAITVRRAAAAGGAGVLPAARRVRSVTSDRRS